MTESQLIIDGTQVSAAKGWTILQAAQSVGIYVPAICNHRDLSSSVGANPNQSIFQGKKSIPNLASDKQFDGCQLCLVEVENRGIVLACATPVADNMVVHTNAPPLGELRQQNLAKILSNHPHACLICPQKEGCSLTYCSSNIPEKERCCPKFNNCELREVAEYIGIPGYTPRYTFQDLPIIVDEPLFKRDYNLCVNCLRCVKACQELRGVKALGFVFDEDGRIHVGTIAPSLKESGCKFCGACVEVCPTGALSDKDIKWTERETALVPCSNACPAGIDIPGYISFIAEGKLGEAVAVIREKVPFPGVLGCVCYHPCETVCRHGELNEAIAICALKCFAAKNDTKLWKKRSKSAPSTGKRVAIIGSGPAGLTAAYYLAKSGHSVTVFEALPEAGGMMRVGIPEYRLPRHVLNSEIRNIQEAGVDIRTNTRIESID